MLPASLTHRIESASTEQLREALHALMKPHATPVFGAAKTIEHEVAALNAMKVLGYIDQAADEFNLALKTRVIALE